MALASSLFNQNVMLFYPYTVDRSYGVVDGIYSDKSFDRIQKELFHCNIDLIFSGDPVPSVSHTMVYVRNQTYLNALTQKIKSHIDDVTASSGENVIVLFAGSDTRDYRKFTVKCLLFFSSSEQRDLFRLTTPEQVFVD